MPVAARIGAHGLQDAQLGNPRVSQDTEGGQEISEPLPAPAADRSRGGQDGALSHEPGG